MRRKKSIRCCFCISCNMH